MSFILKKKKVGGVPLELVTSTWVAGEDDSAVGAASKAVCKCECVCLQHIATHCNTLQHTTTHCNTLQSHHCNKHCDMRSNGTLLFWPLPKRYLCECANVQNSATHCNTLHHKATHCNTRQRSAPHIYTHIYTCIYMYI